MSGLRPIEPDRLGHALGGGVVVPTGARSTAFDGLIGEHSAIVTSPEGGLLGVVRRIDLER